MRVRGIRICHIIKHVEIAERITTRANVALAKAMLWLSQLEVSIMRDCADIARQELAVLCSGILPEVQRIVSKTRPDQRGQVQIELRKLFDLMLKRATEV